MRKYSRSGFSISCKDPKKLKIKSLWTPNTDRKEKEDNIQRYIEIGTERLTGRFLEIINSSHGH